MFQHEKMCLARFRPVQEFDFGDSGVFCLPVGSITGPFTNWSCAGESVTGLLFVWLFNPPLLSAPADSTWHPCHPPYPPYPPPGGGLPFRLASSQDYFPGAHFRSGTHRRVFVVG